MDVHAAPEGDARIDVVQDPGHVRDRRRSEVDDRLGDPCRPALEEPLVRLERVGRMREVDEERDPVPVERAKPTRGGVGVLRAGVGACEQPVGDPVAVPNRNLHGDAAYASPVDADLVELRVLGCLLEKQRTTPDQYPLSLNALRLACNQTTNRDPVVSLDELEIHDALQRLARRGWTRLASGAGSRAAKYRQLFDEAVGLGDDEVAVVCVLLLRGAQTPGELKQRTGRMHAFAGLDEIVETLDRLAARDLVERLPRRPGQKEERFRHLLGGDAEQPVAEDQPGFAPVRAAEGTNPGSARSLEERVAALEAELARVRDVVDTLAGTLERPA